MVLALESPPQTATTAAETTAPTRPTAAMELTRKDSNTAGKWATNTTSEVQTGEFRIVLPPLPLPPPALVIDPPSAFERAGGRAGCVTRVCTSVRS